MPSENKHPRVKSIEFLQFWIEALKTGLSKEKFFDACLAKWPILVVEPAKEGEAKKDHYSKVKSKLYSTQALYREANGENLRIPKSESAGRGEAKDAVLSFAKSIHADMKAKGFLKEKEPEPARRATDK